MLGPMKVTVLIPTLNEEESIGLTLDQIPRSPDLEIAIIDGLSRDRTREIALGKGARVIEEKRRGYGRAYKTGFKEAKGDIIVTLDGDTTYPAEKIPELVKLLENEGSDFITCERMTKAEKGAFSMTHRFGNWVLKVTMNVLFGTRLKDSQSGMWVFKRSILPKLSITSDGMAMSEELKIEAFRRKDLRCKEVPIPYRVRVGEKALNTWKDGFRNLIFLFKKRFGPGSLGPPETY
ncbi:MAG: glycosyltransferase family 2 protein [Candidatus Thermoplasmatota archaeon]|nr:glycosyltransferase family 2 protein [Candidatus Thermoplasmatota archaeon]